MKTLIFSLLVFLIGCSQSEPPCQPTTTALNQSQSFTCPNDGQVFVEIKGCQFADIRVNSQVVSSCSSPGGTQTGACNAMVKAGDVVTFTSKCNDNGITCSYKVICED